MPPDTSVSCLQMNFLDCFLPPNQRSTYFFPPGSAPVPEPAPLQLLPPPGSAANANSFKATDISLPHTVDMKKPVGSRTASACPPHQPWGCRCRPHAPGPGPCLASVWLNKPLLSEKLSVTNIFGVTLLSLPTQVSHSGQGRARQREETTRLPLCFTVLAARHGACHCAQWNERTPLHCTSPWWQLRLSK